MTTRDDKDKGLRTAYRNKKKQLHKSLKLKKQNLAHPGTEQQYIK